MECSSQIIDAPFLRKGHFHNCKSTDLNVKGALVQNVTMSFSMTHPPSLELLTPPFSRPPLAAGELVVIASQNPDTQACSHRLPPPASATATISIALQQLLLLLLLRLLLLQLATRSASRHRAIPLHCTEQLRVQTSSYLLQYST